MVDRTNGGIIPCEVTVEIASRGVSRRRGYLRADDLRASETICVAVTYRLEDRTNVPLQESELASVIRRSVRLTRDAYRFVRLGPLQPVVEVKTDEIGTDGALEESQPSAVLGIEQEQAAPRKLTQAQKKTLEIMARQLNLEGRDLSDLLGLRCNRQRLDDLSYRQAAGLIAYFCGLLRQRLQKEKETKTGESKT